MSRTIERLRETATAMGATITEQDLPELRLGETVRPPASRRWARGRWLIPVMAAVAVLLAVGSATVIDKLIRLHDGPRGKVIPGPTLIAPVTGTPTYLVISQGAHGYVKLVATGRTIAKIQPPVKGYLIEGVAAAPGNRIFYLAGQVLGRPGGQLMFFRIKLRPDGQPLPARSLPGRSIRLPFPITSNGLVNIPLAVSPDGTQIAFTWPNQLLAEPASQPTVITVRNVATGAFKTWEVRSSGQTEVSELSWAVDGQLSFVATVGSTTVRNGLVVRDSHRNLNVLAILNTLRPAGQLFAASRLISYSSQLMSDQVTTPSGVQAAVITADGGTVIAQVLGRDGSARLVEISVATRKVTRVLLSGQQAFQVDPVAVDGDNALFTLSPKHEHPTGSYVCGHLALAKLSTGRITGLPFPVYCSTAAPPPPFYATW